MRRLRRFVAAMAGVALAAIGVSAAGASPGLWQVYDDALTGRATST
jgi:hypothetical protein